MRNKIFTRIIITTLLCAFLTFSVGKVTRVYAVGTTAAIAGTAFILTGAIYMSYVALTQGQMTLPVADDLHAWLGSIGRKVSQYPSGASAYQEVYQGLLKDPTANVIDGVWTWTQDRLRSFANDFSDTRIISDIVSYYQEQDINTQILNHFEYTFTPVTVDYVSDGGVLVPLVQWYSFGFIPVYGTPVAVVDGQNMAISYLYDGLSYRNILFTDNTYGIQYFRNGTWFTRSSYLQPKQRFVRDNVNYDYAISFSSQGINYNNGLINNVSVYHVNYPVLTQADTYIEATGEVIEADLPVAQRIQPPSWVDPDNENRPIIPWVPIPDIPTGVPTPPGYTGPPQWGVPLAELLDLLEELAEGLIKIDAIARLINEFAGQHGDNYYLEYNDGDTNYYSYYQPTVFDNDTEYVTYNINVSEQEDVLPVDLNTISLYTQNRYLEQIKNSAVAGSSMLRDLAVFWHDVDPEVTYIVFGYCILVLIGAFTGKLGHS